MNLLAQIKADGHLLNRPAPPKKGGKRIRSATPKRASQLKEYSLLRSEYLKQHPWCEIWLKREGFTEDDVTDSTESGGIIEIDWDNGRGVVSRIHVPLATEIHHPAGRIGKKLADKTNFCACSRKQHLWLHANPSTARALGLLA